MKMKMLVTHGFWLVLGFLLVVGCGGRSGLQPFSPLSANHNTPRSAGLSGVHEAVAVRELTAHPASYTITDLGTLGGSFSAAGSVNNRGAASGITTLRGDTVIRGFLWTGGSLIDLGALPAGPNNVGQNVNEKLQITGAADGAASRADSNATCWTASSHDSHTYIWQSGVLTDLGTLGGNSSKGSVINDSGQIAGLSQIQAVDPNGFVACGGSPGSQMVHAFLFENGKMKDIGTLGGYDSAANAINDRGQVGGGSDVSTAIDPTTGYPRHHPYLWTNGVMRDLGTLGGQFGFDEQVTNDGSVVGFTTLAGEQHAHAFLWQNGVMSDLGVLPGDTDSDANYMNGLGQVIGFSATSSAVRAFIWQNGAMTDLNTLISPSSGFQLAIAYTINNAGQISAQAVVERTGETHAVILTPSNNSIRGKAGGAPLTPSLRKYLHWRYGFSRLKFITSNR
jgi:probable HAF family extracellular repeat protein